MKKARNTTRIRPTTAPHSTAILVKKPHDGSIDSCTKDDARNKERDVKMEMKMKMEMKTEMMEN